MKKKKIDGLDMAIAFLILIVLALLIACIFMVLKNKNQATSIKQESDVSCECEETVSFLCTNKTDDGEFSYTIHVDSTGEMKDYYVKHTNIYDENTYESIKEMRQSSDTVKFEFNDETHEIITTSFYNDGLLDGNGDSIHRWYKDFTSDLEESGFACQEE